MPHIMTPLSSSLQKAISRRSRVHVLGQSLGSLIPVSALKLSQNLIAKSYCVRTSPTGYLNRLSILYLDSGGQKKMSPTGYLLDYLLLLAQQIPSPTTYFRWANKSEQLFFLSLPRRSLPPSTRTRARQSPLRRRPRTSSLPVRSSPAVLPRRRSPSRRRHGSSPAISTEDGASGLAPTRRPWSTAVALLAGAAALLPGAAQASPAAETSPNVLRPWRVLPSSSPSTDGRPCCGPAPARSARTAPAPVRGGSPRWTALLRRCGPAPARGLPGAAAFSTTRARRTSKRMTHGTRMSWTAKTNLDAMF
jgi:hypothetical protein